MALVKTERHSRQCSTRLITGFFITLSVLSTQGFVARPRAKCTDRSSASWLFSKSIDNNDEEEMKRGTRLFNMEALELEQFKRRKDVVEHKALQNQWRRPPNPLLSPDKLVKSLLEELRHPTSRSSGVLALLESSAHPWRSMLCRSVGAPEETVNEYLAPSLELALGRPRNQFAILMGVEDANYQITFPTDPLEYEDTCWVECRLRGESTDELLVAMGWSLVPRPSDGAWIVDGLDWQDFREAYRPGIGREEWERICG